jgi:hypothetical protein
MDQDIAFYISIITGFLLTISETLPLIKSVRSNGILDLVINFLKTKFDNRLSNLNNSENEPLLQAPQETDNVIIRSNNISIVSDNIRFTFNSPNVQLDFNEGTT